MYELEYELDVRLADHRPENETLLFEWCLECLNIDLIEAVDVHRQDRGDVVDVQIVIGANERYEAAIANDTFQSHLDELERWVGDFSIRCVPSA